MKPRKRKQWRPVADAATNGAMFVERNALFPGIERVTIRSYCGRNGDNRRFYRLADDSSLHFISVKTAAN